MNNSLTHPHQGSSNHSSKLNDYSELEYLCIGHICRNICRHFEMDPLAWIEMKIVDVIDMTTFYYS